MLKSSLHSNEDDKEKSNEQVEENQEQETGEIAVSNQVFSITNMLRHI